MVRLSFRFILFILLTLIAAGGVLVAVASPPQQGDPLPPIVFVARSHLATEDDIFRDEVGPAGQFGSGIPKFAPYSKLFLRNPDGTLMAYNTPGLVDVQSPDVNFDGTKIVFAGATTLDEESSGYGWRLYEINVNGTGFHQLTFSDRNIEIPNANLFGNQETYGWYNDLFPAYLADGRIVFNSSRYPTRSHYDERHSYNLYVMNGDGSGLHRITTERAGLLHPTPLPDGRILVSRWWNQFNQPSDQSIYNRIDNADETYTLPDGTLIVANPDHQFNPANAILPGGYPVRVGPNSWHLMVVNPDGTDFHRFASTPRYTWDMDNDSGHDTYTAAQPAVILNGSDWLIAYTSQQDSSMVHSTLKTGIRIAYPGLEMMYANTTDAIAGLTYDQAWGEDDDSGPYAIHPWGLPDGRILYSQSSEDNSLPTGGTYEENGETYDLQGSNLHYQLYTMSVDGSAQTLISIDLSPFGLATADLMDAKPVYERVGWTALPDTFADVPNDDPRLGNIPNTLAEYWFSLNGPNDILTATVHNPNVYANGSLHSPFVNNSPPTGSVATAQVWIDANQFTGAYCYDDWPDPCATYRQDAQVRAVLWTEVPVSLSGEFTATIPADTMGFVVLRDENGRVVRNWNRGYISIAQGSAWARPGETVTCTGCHLGHVSGSIDDVEAEAELGWTNVAPYTQVTASSYHEAEYDPFIPARVVDRRGWVPKPEGGPGVSNWQDDETGWISAEDTSVGEWVELNWPNNLTVTRIRLVGPPPVLGDWGGFGNPAKYGDYYVETATVDLYLDGSLIDSLSVGRIEPLSNGGTVITFDTPITIDRLRFTVNEITGRWHWSERAALNEIEVMGQAAEPSPPLQIWQTFLPNILR